MNIKEHIEAGHYPTDDKGRALVPVEPTGAQWTGWTAAICATDGPRRTIIGFGAGSARTWREDGSPDGHDEGRLLPPPSREPRIIEKWVLVDRAASEVYLLVGNGLRSNRDNLEHDRKLFIDGNRLMIARVLIEDPQ